MKSTFMLVSLYMLLASQVFRNIVETALDGGEQIEELEVGGDKYSFSGWSQVCKGDCLITLEIHLP